MGLDAVPAGDPDHLEAPALDPARLGQLLAQRVDLLHRHLEQLGQQPGGHRLDGDDQDGLDGPGLGRERHAQPSYSSTGRPRPPPGPGGRRPTTSSSPKVWP